ncbi:MAG: choice-of-anchor Q domain-containing protein [Acidimicrobiales bacterium]
MTAGSVSLLFPAPAFAAGASVYAAATGGVGTTCSLSAPCTFAQALLGAHAGNTIFLTTPGATGHYVGNWTVSTPATTASLPLTIEPAPGVTNPILDGNLGSPVGCTTTACNGSILDISPGVSLTVENITIQNGKKTVGDGTGGGIDVADGGVGETLTVSGVTFTGNNAGVGGALNSAGGFGGVGNVIVTNSTFFSNSAQTAGGAIATGALFGTDTMSVSGSTFVANSATYGGAIVNGYFGGKGTLGVSTSTFLFNTGGTIDNAVYFGSGAALVLDSTFASNSSPITSGLLGGSAVTGVAADIFGGSCLQAGTWIDGGYDVGADTTCFASGVSTDTADKLVSTQLGALANNGGSTETMEPLAGPAIGDIPNPTTTFGGALSLCPTTDQRGVVGPAAPTKCNSGSVQKDPVLAFTADSPPSASLCSSYAYDFAAGGAPGLTFTVASGTLPSGLTLSPSGALSGLPNLTGTFTFTVSAAFGPNDTVTSPSLSITVSGACTAGTTTEEGTVVLSPSTLPFGSVKVGSMSSPQTFTLTNLAARRWW